MQVLIEQNLGGSMRIVQHLESSSLSILLDLEDNGLVIVLLSKFLSRATPAVSWWISLGNINNYHPAINNLQEPGTNREITLSLTQCYICFIYNYEPKLKENKPALEHLAQEKYKEDS